MLLNAQFNNNISIQFVYWRTVHESDVGENKKISATQMTETTNDYQHQ